MIISYHPVATPANAGAKRFHLEAYFTFVLATNHSGAKILRA